MDVASVMDIGRHALFVVVLVASPMLGLGLIVGLIIGVLQAATSVNEMTLTLFQNFAVGLGIAFLDPG